MKRRAMPMASAVLAVLALTLPGGRVGAQSGGGTAVDRAAGSPASARDECLTCHLDVDGGHAQAYQSDVHHAVGITCAGCHGGDPTTDDKDDAMSARAGYIGVPKPAQIPRVCGRCHGAEDNPYRSRWKLKDVRSDFEASVHGRALAGNSKGPQCVSCHGVHGILATDDPRAPVHPRRVVETCSRCHSSAAYMKDFDPALPVDQHEKYLTSVHGQRHAKGDVKVATCVSCHGQHLVHEVKDPRSPVYPTRIPGTCGHCHEDARIMAGYGIPTTQLRDYRRSVHGKALLERGDLNAPACNSCHGNHGAAPPGVNSVPAVCGQCHQLNEELYEKSAHRAVFAREKRPGCVVCHGNHHVESPSDAMIAYDASSPCSRCHKEGDRDSAAVGIARIRGLLDSLRAGQQGAVRALDRAEQLGMDVADARYSLKDVNQSVVRSRVAIHSFKPAELEAAARPGIQLIASARQAGLDAVREYGFRRTGLLVSTLIVTALCVLLWLKIRQIERRQRAAGS